MTNQYIYMIFGHKICVIFLFYNEYYMYSTFHYRNGRSCQNWNVRVIMPFQANTQLSPPQVYWCVRATHLFSFMCILFFCCFFFVLCLVINVACVSGLSILDCPFGFLQSLFNQNQDTANKHLCTFNMYSDTSSLCRNTSNIGQFNKHRDTTKKYRDRNFQ